MMDLVVMGLLIGQAIGRWGNFLNREAFGSETALPWRMQLTTTAGELVEVHPTFLYESLWNVIGPAADRFCGIQGPAVRRREHLLLLPVVRCGPLLDRGSAHRQPVSCSTGPSPAQPIRVSQVLSLLLMIAALAVLFYNIRLHPHRPEELYVNQVAAREAAQAEEPAEAPEATEPAEAPEAAEPAEAPEAPEVPEESSEE